MPKISVILPVYNSEKYLKEAIESILNQTFDDFELIIINDGSNDSSLKIINKYKNNSKVNIISRENKGLVDTLNEGIKFSKGKYIARMDSDDISYRNRLEKQFSYMENNKEVDILGTSIDIIGNKEKSKQIQNKQNKNFNTIKNLEELFFKYGCLISHPSVMFRKSLFSKIGLYNKNFSYAEDYELWLRALSNKIKIDKLNNHLLKYRVYQESKSNKENNKNYNVTKQYIKIRLEYLFKKINIKEIKSYYIWGSGKAGFFSKEILENYLTKSTFLGFLDSYNNRKIENINIYNYNILNNFCEKPYIFVATTPGKESITNELLKLNYKFPKNFCWLV